MNAVARDLDQQRGEILRTTNRDFRRAHWLSVGAAVTTLAFGLGVYKTAESTTAAVVTTLVAAAGGSGSIMSRGKAKDLVSSRVRGYAELVDRAKYHDPGLTLPQRSEIDPESVGDEPSNLCAIGATQIAMLIATELYTTPGMDGTYTEAKLFGASVCTGLAGLALSTLRPSTSVQRVEIALNNVEKDMVVNGYEFTALSVQPDQA